MIVIFNPCTIFSVFEPTLMHNFDVYNFYTIHSLTLPYTTPTTTTAAARCPQRGGGLRSQAGRPPQAYVPARPIAGRSIVCKRCRVVYGVCAVDVVSYM